MGEITAAQALLGSAIISGVGMVASGQASARAAAIQRQVLLQQAARERELAERNADIFRREQNALSAAERVRRAGAGVLTGEGTPLLVSDAIIDETLLGEATIRQGGVVRATRLSEQATLARLRGRAAQTESLFRAGSTLLTGFGDFKRFS